MGAYFKLRRLFLSGAIMLAAAALSACITQFNRDLEDVLGPAARDRVETIGAPDKNCALYKLNLTHTYGIVINDHIIRLGEEFPSVRIVKQFATGRADNAVVECARANGAVDNYLFQAESGTKANLYQLDSHTKGEFGVTAKDGLTFLVQKTDDPKKWMMWTVSAGDVRGPIEGTISSTTGGKKSGKTAGRSKAMPRIKKDNSFKLEADTPPAPKPASADIPPAQTPSTRTSTPAGPGEAPYKAIETPDLD